MSLALSSAPPRRLAALFLALTLAPAGGLVWLGWRLLEQDRALEVQRTQERREYAAGLVSSALGRELATTRRRLTEPHQAADLASSPDSLVVVFRQQRVEALPAGRLLFHPFVPTDAGASGSVDSEFLRGEECEFQRQDFAKAIESFQGLTLSRDPAVRAGALLRLARNYRKAGNPRLALAAYEQLADIKRVAIAGVPSELVARRAQCALLGEMGRSGELHKQAGAIYRDLLDGHWRLTRSAYQLHASQARAWLGQSDEGERGRLALSDAVERLWEQWQAQRASDRPIAATAVLRLHDRCLTILSHEAGESMAAFIAGPQYIETQWLTAATGALKDEDHRVYLIDTDGNAVNAQPPAGSGRRTLRLSSDTGLPWTIVVVSTATHGETKELASRRRLLFTGLALAVILVLTSGYLAARMVSRDLTVAQLKSEFVSAVSHEFRTPLATLSQLNENLAEGRVTTEERRNAYYHAQSRATNRLHRLVERLLDFGRMEAVAFRHRPKAVDLGSLTRTVVDEFEHVAATSRHEIRVTVEPELPRVEADPEALGQILWNLLDNAIKYSPGQPAVWVEVAREDGFVAIRVRDQGLGIPDQERKRLFQKFVRGSAADAANVKGAGIGLAMVDYVVRAHGGRIRLESAPGEGSTFTVLLKMGAR